MRIVWLAWKDIQHPQAGGAETVSSELGKRLVRDGHELIFVTGGFPGNAPEALIDGYRVVRVGNRYSVYWRAYRYITQQLRSWPDLVIEEVNTVPFFTRFYVRQRRQLFFHMLCRKIWFYQLPLPASLVGYVLEPLYLRLLRRDPAVAMSESTRHDLQRHGFPAAHIAVISEGIQLTPAADLKSIDKFNRPTMLSLGSIRPMKRTLHQLRAFELAKAELPDLQLKMAGETDSRYGRKVLQAISSSPYRHDIEYLGRVSADKKQALMQHAHVITVTSVKEGWGLIVTEAASQGTPAVVYDVDGLRDSVRDQQTGIIVRPTPQALAAGVVKLLANPDDYQTLRRNAWEWSKDITFKTSYQQFKEALSL